MGIQASRGTMNAWSFLFSARRGSSVFSNSMGSSAFMSTMLRSVFRAGGSRMYRPTLAWTGRTGFSLKLVARPRGSVSTQPHGSWRPVVTATLAWTPSRFTASMWLERNRSGSVSSRKMSSGNAMKTLRFASIIPFSIARFSALPFPTFLSGGSRHHLALAPSSPRTLSASLTTSSNLVRTANSLKPLDAMYLMHLLRSGSPLSWMRGLGVLMNPILFPSPPAMTTTCVLSTSRSSFSRAEGTAFPECPGI